MIDTSKLTVKTGGYQLASSSAVTDKILLEIAGQYDTAVSRKMTALKPADLPKRFTSSENILETTKYDGEGVFLYYEQNKEMFAFNAPSGRVRLGLPVLIELQKQLSSQGVKKGLFRAELYLPSLKDGRRAGVSEVIRVSFNGTEAEVAALKLALLDVIMLDGKDLRPNLDNFQVNWDLLAKLFGTDTARLFHRAEGTIIPENQAGQVLDRKVAAGQEGLVLRRLNRLDLYKVKPHLTVDAAVIGYIEGEFEGQVGVTSILTGLTYPGRKNEPLLFQTFARVGSGITDQQRVELLDSFAAIRVDAPIPITDSDGRAVNFVKPRFLLELEGDDLISATPQDRQNRTQLFAYGQDRFTFQGLTPCPRMTFPIFSKLRPDKDVLSGGARLEQILKNPQLPLTPAAVPPESKILRREVYTKAEAVRKLVVVQKGGENVVPYLVYWTDFSAKRKDPLKVSSAFAYTETRAQALAEKFLAENVTKGFVRVGGPVPVAPPAASEPEKTEKPKTAKAPRRKAE